MTHRWTVSTEMMATLAPLVRMDKQVLTGVMVIPVLLVDQALTALMALLVTGVWTESMA